MPQSTGYYSAEDERQIRCLICDNRSDHEHDWQNDAIHWGGALIVLDKPTSKKSMVPTKRHQIRAFGGCECVSDA